MKFDLIFINNKIGLAGELELIWIFKYYVNYTI